MSDIPPLTQTMINFLVTQSPLHAWVNNRYLNPDYKEEVSKEMDRGKIVHAMLLEDEDIAVPIDYPDYRTHQAREARDEVRASGKCPILATELKGVQNMCEAARLQMEAYKDIRGGFVGGRGEVKLEWIDIETGVRCKARLDYLQDDHRVILDYKTTKGSAHPDAVSRNLFDRGYDIQGCWYIRAVLSSRFTLIPEPEFYLVTQEVYEPYALSVVALAPDAKWYGRRRCEDGLKLWKQSLDTGIWPGYLRETAWATLPGWLEKQQIEKEMREQDAV